MAIARPLLVVEEPTVFLIQVDPSTCHSVKRLLERMPLRMHSFATPEEFLRDSDPDTPGCVLISLFASRPEDLALLAELARRGIHLPVIVLCGRDEVRLVVQAMRAGAWNVLRTPCADQDLAEALYEALERDAENRRQQAYWRKVEQRLLRLTSGERDVLELLMRGKSNRQIATILGVSARTVEERRAKVMHKMHAGSLAELVRLTLIASTPAGQAGTPVNEVRAFM